MSIEVGTRIAELRKQKKLTQEALSEKTNISNVLISKYENGTEMGLENLIKIATALETSLDYIIFGDGEKLVKYNDETKKTTGYKNANAIADLCEEGIIDIDDYGNGYFVNKYGSYDFYTNYKAIILDDDRSEKGYEQFINAKIKKYAKRVDDEIEAELEPVELPFY